MAPRSILFEELSRTELRRLAEADALAVLPIGATEQHGPHLPTGTDKFHAEWVAHAAARTAAEQIPVVVVPTLAYGSSAHHMPFGGTMSLRTKTFYDVVYQLCESLVDDGFRRIFIVNGHGGNHELVVLVARDLALARPVAIAGSSWWALAWEPLGAAGAHERGRFPGHAGLFETSLVMAMRPDLAATFDVLPHRDDPGTSDPRAFGGAYRSEIHGFWQSIDGFTDSPDLADPDQGRRWLDTAAGALAAAFVEFHAQAHGRGADLDPYE